MPLLVRALPPLAKVKSALVWALEPFTVTLLGGAGSEPLTVNGPLRTTLLNWFRASTVKV